MDKHNHQFGFFVFLLIAICAGCVTAPVTPLTSESHSYGKDDDEKKLIQRATAADEELRRKGLLFEDENVASYVREIGNRIAPKLPANPDLTFRFNILRDPTVNAFALPNGSIYLHVGLLARLENEAQLALLLGHEIAHVVYRHGLQGQRTRKATIVTANIADIALFGTSIAYLPAFAALASYSREHESDADRFGLTRMSAAGYSPREAERFFELLQEVKKKESVFGSMYSSHPDNRQRAAQARELIANEKLGAGVEGRIGAKEYAAMREQLILETVRLKLNVKQYQLAADSTQKGLLHNPASVWLHYYHGEAYRLMAEDPAGAAREYAWANDKKLNDELFAEMRNKKQALLIVAKRSFQKALEVDKRFTESYRGLGLVAYAENEYQKAREALNYYLTNGQNINDRRYINNILGRLDSHER